MFLTVLYIMRSNGQVVRCGRRKQFLEIDMSDRTKRYHA